MEMTKLLLDRGASIDLQAGNAKSHRGKWTPLFAAASLGQCAKALHLLERGAGFGPQHQSNTGEVVPVSQDTFPSQMKT